MRWSGAKPVMHRLSRMDSLCITGLPRDQSINCNSTVASSELYLSVPHHAVPHHTSTWWCCWQCDEDVTSIMFIIPNDHDRIKGLYRRWVVTRPNWPAICARAWLVNPSERSITLHGGLHRLVQAASWRACHTLHMLPEINYNIVASVTLMPRC